MFNLNKQSKAVILVIYDKQVQCFVWVNDSLSHIYNLGRDPDEKFRHMLEDYREYPVILITDLLEESFRHDTGAHVNGPDRAALLERKLNYSFRNTVYRAATIVGREKEGRKDDKILLSALTKPELLDAWVRTLLDMKMQIQSVTSVAYLMEAYAQKAKLSDKHLLVVSLEKESELRQTYLREGKIHFSRLTSLTTKETADLPDAINHESMQIRQYLERIKLLPFESQLVIKVFSPFNINQQAMESNSNELNKFESFNTQEIAQSLSLVVDGIDTSATPLYLARVLQKSKARNVYAPLHIRKYFHLKNTSTAMIAGSCALILLITALKIPSLIDAMSNWEQQETLLAQAAPLEREYEILTQSFPDTPIPSQEMALVVETAEKIMKHAYFPGDALALTSEALSMSPDLQITRIAWSIGLGDARAEEEDPSGLLGPDRNASSGPAQPVTREPGMEIQNATLMDQVGLNMRIDGMAYSPQSYRQAQNQVLAFIAALNQIPGVSVISSKMPTEVRVDTSVSTLVDSNALQAPFVLEVSIETN